MKTISVVLADAHQIFIEGLKVVFSRSEDLRAEVAGEATTGSQLLKIIDSTKVDLVVLDMNLPDMDGLEAIARIREHKSDAKILTLSMYDESKILKAAFKAGVDGYILKSSSFHEFYKAVKAVLEGDTYIGFGLSLMNGTGMHSRFLQEGKLSTSYDDRFLKKYHLTKRELEVLKLIGQALSNKDIAKDLYISDQTVSVHRKNIMRKLGVGNTASLIKMAFENNLL